MARTEPPPTRADVARQRLAQLAEAFNAELPPDEPPETAGVRPDAPALGQPVGQSSGQFGTRPVMPAHLRVVAAVAVAAGVLLGWYLLAGRPQESPPVQPVGFTSSASTAGAPTAPAGEIVVDIIGDVKQPGIVTLPAGSRVHHAVEAAGGLTTDPEDSGINMARLLQDGEQIVVGGEAVASASGVDPAGKVNLNQATVEELDTLPGVGPVTAGAIVSWRDENGGFRSVDDLLDVQGIGDGTLAKLRDLVTI